MVYIYVRINTIYLAKIKIDKNYYETIYSIIVRIDIRGNGN